MPNYLAGTENLCRGQNSFTEVFSATVNPAFKVYPDIGADTRA